MNSLGMSAFFFRYSFLLKGLKATVNSKIIVYNFRYEDCF